MSDAKRIKFTAPVRRGLVACRHMLVDCAGVDPGTAAMRLRKTAENMNAKETRDFNAAMAWLEQVEADLSTAVQVETDSPTEGGGSC